MSIDNGKDCKSPTEVIDIYNKFKIDEKRFENNCEVKTPLKTTVYSKSEFLTSLTSSKFKPRTPISNVRSSDFYSNYFVNKIETKPTAKLSQISNSAGVRVYRTNNTVSQPGPEVDLAPRFSKYSDIKRGTVSYMSKEEKNQTPRSNTRDSQNKLKMGMPRSIRQIRIQ